MRFKVQRQGFTAEGAEDRRGQPEEDGVALRASAPSAVTVSIVGVRWLMLLALALPAILGGCSEASGRADNFAVRDSAGVQIAESGGPAWTDDEVWRLGAAPMLSIGEAEGAPEYLLSGVRSVWRLESGEIVATSGTSEFRYFDATGRHLRTVGKRGGGPGEFQMLSWVQPVAGDSVLAYDMAARRLSIFASDGAFVRSTALEGSPEAGTPQLLGALGDGSLVGSVGSSIGRGPAGGIDGLVRGAQDFLHLTASGETLDTISRQPGSERFIQTRSSAGQITSISVMTTLFGRNQVATLAGDRIILGGNDSYQLEVYTPAGRLERLIRRDVAPRPVTEHDLESALQARLESISDPARRENMDREYRKMPLPETVPFYQAALVDEEGNLWVQDFSPGEPPSGWSVFDQEGRFLGTVAMPDRFRPQQIGDDYMLGVARDELDVERVQIYALEKP